jgi:iron complex outermembrane receptor protein
LKKINHKIALAVMVALGSQALHGTAGAADASASPAASADAAADPGIATVNSLQEVTVTAQRRRQSIQNVPITVQAITGDRLKQLNAQTIDDVIQYLPNVQLASNGPGQGQIYMRGLAAGNAGNQSSATISPFPNVALYLDNQAMTFPARNADIYFVDMQRVEVLEGPQGTLFGGGAEAGAVRYITNKPVLDKTSGEASATYGVTAHGDPNSAGNLVLNLPLISDHLAARVVLYDDRQGGYITNVASNFTRSNEDTGNYYAKITPGANGLCPNGLPTQTGYCAVPGSPVANNDALAGSASNPVTYSGMRASALYKINDDWDFLIAQMYQDMNAQGADVQYPVGSDGQTLGPWEATIFSPAYDKDRLENTAWTLNGDIDHLLKVVYTGGYTVRNIEQQEDYTNYARSGGGWYYTCTGGTGLGASTRPTCYSPIGSWNDRVRNTHQSHEIRLSTPDNLRVRGLFGLYYEDFQIQDDMNFNYKTIPSCTPEALTTALAGGAPCVANVRPAPGTPAWDPSVRPDNTGFGEDSQRGYKQTAAFMSVDFDLLPKVLTVTAGTRYYHYTEYQTGSQYGTGTGCVDVPNGDCSGGMHPMNYRSSYHGFKSRANLTWHVSRNVMAYFTFSQGFRPGAFNRVLKDVAPDANGNAQYQVQTTYAPDSLTNYEVGLKTVLLNHHLQLNLSAYHMLWDNAQFLFFNPAGGWGNTSFAFNGPNYKVDGAELQLNALVTTGLTVQGSLSYNKAQQTNSPCLVDNEPTLLKTGGANPNFGQCITEIKGKPATNPLGPAGTVPSFSPKLEYNLHARYQWAAGDYEPFVQVGLAHVGSMFNEPASYPDGLTNPQCGGSPFPGTTLCRYEQPGYTTYDASLGVSKDAWTVTLFGQNLGNNDASLFTSTAQFIKSEVPLRPRVLGVTVDYQF